MCLLMQNPNASARREIEEFRLACVRLGDGSFQSSLGWRLAKYRRSKDQKLLLDFYLDPHTSPRSSESPTSKRQALTSRSSGRMLPQSRSESQVEQKGRLLFTACWSLPCASVVNSGPAARTKRQTPKVLQHNRDVSCFSFPLSLCALFYSSYAFVNSLRHGAA